MFYQRKYVLINEFSDVKLAYGLWSYSIIFI